MTSRTTQFLSDLFVFPFKSPDWQKKALIGAALSLAGFFTLFISSIFVTGYLARLMRRVIAGEEPVLPEWDDWGKLFLDGLRIAAAGLIYSLPMIVLSILGYVAFVGPAFIPLFTHANQEAGFFFLTMIGIFVGYVFFGVAILLALVVGLLAPAAIAHLVAKDSLAAAFHFRDWWAIFRANLSGFLVAFIFVLGLVMLLTLVYQVLFLTLILCCLAPFVLILLSFYQALVGGALYAVAYREGAGLRADLL